MRMSDWSSDVCSSELVVTRFGIAAGDGEHRRLDLVYPVAALKPHTLSLTGKVHPKSAEPEPEWRNGITRAVMTVKFPVRSVLAEPVIRSAEHTSELQSLMRLSYAVFCLQQKHTIHH